MICLHCKSFLVFGSVLLAGGMRKISLGWLSNVLVVGPSVLSVGEFSID